MAILIKASNRLLLIYSLFLKKLNFLEQKIKKLKLRYNKSNLKCYKKSHERIYQTTLMLTELKYFIYTKDLIENAPQ